MRHLTPRSLLLTAALALVILPAAAPEARAGWVIEEVDPDFPGESVTYFFEGTKVRVEGLLPRLVLLLDLQAGEGFIIDENKGKYAGGSIEEISAAIQKEGWGRIRGASWTEPPAGGSAESLLPPEINLERSLEKQTVAGFDTDHYRVYVGEELVEELWIAPGIDPLPAEKLPAFREALQRARGGLPAAAEGFPPGYEDHPDYREMRGAGFPARQTLHFIGEKETVEIRSAGRIALSLARFRLPEGGKKVDYVRLLLGVD